MMVSMLGCVPLWFTDSPGPCGPLNISREAVTSAYDLFYGLYIGKYPSRCKHPCNRVHYKVSHKSKDPKENGRQLFIVFRQEVDVVRTQLVINTFNLVTRIGGLIGFCKEVLWIILLTAGTYQFFLKMSSFIACK